MNEKPSARIEIQKFVQNHPNLTPDEKQKIANDYLNNKRLRLLVDDLNEIRRRGWITL